MEKYSSYDDAITGLQNEVSRYSSPPKSLPSNSVQSKETNFISSNSIPKINFKKVLIAFPIILFFVLVYYKPEFIMVEKPYDKKGKKIDYSKVIITVTFLTGFLYFIKCSL